MKKKILPAVISKGARKASEVVEELQGNHAKQGEKVQRIQSGKPVNKKLSRGNLTFGHPP